MQARELLLNACDVVVMDEAHELRNPTSEICKAMMMLRTRRRLALTGYPLQVRCAVGGLLGYEVGSGAQTECLMSTAHAPIVCANTQWFVCGCGTIVLQL